MGRVPAPRPTGPSRSGCSATRPGRRSVVSHMAKHTRGEVARHLLESGADPRTVEGLAEALADRWDVELHRPAKPGRPWTVDVVVRG